MENNRLSRTDVHITLNILWLEREDATVPKNVNELKSMLQIN